VKNVVSKKMKLKGLFGQRLLHSLMLITLTLMQQHVQSLVYNQMTVPLSTKKDGSVIDEEEVLQEFKGGILMLLTGDEVWSPATSLSGDSAPVGTPTTYAGCC
jgi:hypothetical protein